MSNPFIFKAVSSSARQLLILLRCIPPSSKAHIRLSSEGLRISTDEGSTTESFVFIAKALFTTFNFHAPSDGPHTAADESTVFQIDLNALLETLSIFTLSDVPTSKQSATTEAYAAHRLNRHAGINAFSSSALGMNGICTFTYESEGSPLSIHMSEAGVTTTCDLTTYSPAILDEIPFSRDALALKTIMQSSYLLDAVSELSSFNPTHLTISATPASEPGSSLKFSAVGSLGSASVDFATSTSSETPILETFNCSDRVSASFRFSLVKSAQRAMATASKVSLRLDEEGVLSLQFLIELEDFGTGQDVAFVDFRIVPLIDDEVEQAGTDSDDSNQ